MSGIVFNHSVVSSVAINSLYFSENTADSGIQTSSQINKLTSKSNIVFSSMMSVLSISIGNNTSSLYP